MLARRWLSSTRCLLQQREKNRFKQTLSLEEFLFRKKVLQTYRGAMRICYKNHEKDELVNFLRDEFKLNSHQKDLSYRKYLLTIGEHRIDQMASLLGISISR